MGMVKPEKGREKILKQKGFAYYALGGRERETKLKLNNLVGCRQVMDVMKECGG